MMNLAAVVMTASVNELAVLNYWVKKAHTRPRSPKVVEDYLKRIRKRLDEGYTVEDLQRCVDFACFDQWYRLKGYFRQPEVIWRNAERVQSLLSRVEHMKQHQVPL